MFRRVSDSKKLENLLALSTWSCLARLSTASVFCLSLDTNNNESYHHNLVTSITHVTKTSLSTRGLQPLSSVLAEVIGNFKVILEAWSCICILSDLKTLKRNRK